jgi:hypothetical protein
MFNNQQNVFFLKRYLTKIEFGVIQFLINYLHLQK